jgi:hypothetical protein
MKTTQKIKTWAVRLFGAALLAAAITTQAQNTTTSVTNNFDAANSATGWTYWYDAYNGMYNSIILNWDGTMNHGGAAGSGSVVFTNLWAGHPGGEQCQIWGTFAHSGGNQYDFSTSIDGTKYDTITFDVHANADAPTNRDGNLCQLTVGFFCNTFSVHGTANVNIPTSATNGWYHVVANVNKADAGLSAPAVGWAMNINCYGGGNTLLPGSANNTYLWIDNIQANRSKTIAPPPRMSPKITAAIPGLDLFLDNQYDRSSIKAVQTTGLGFLGQPDTTYFLTISNFPPSPKYTNNQAHLFIATPDNASSIDYNTPNLIWLNITETTNGRASANFRYKIFEPGSNTNMFGTNYTVGPVGTPWAGTLTNLNAATPIGTWTMTFHQDTNVTLTGPGGVSTTFTIDPNVAAQFTDPLNIVFGAQPNDPSPPDSGTSFGQVVVMSEVGISNTSSSLLDDQFLTDAGVLNTGLWTISAANAPDVQVFPNDPGQMLVNWSIPDTSFWMETATNITGPWFVLTGSGAATPVTTYVAGGNNALVPSANLSASHSFFRMHAYQFTKLQILMPGETATPGVAPGKTGTPDSQAAGNAFNVTVNAVDANWNPAPYASDLDNIHITSSDGSATLPSDAQLIGGTGTFSVTLNASGTWTITASDTTQPGKTADTGTPEVIP